MSESTALAETPVTPSPSDPAPQETAKGQDAQNQVEPKTPPDSEPGAAQAANPEDTGQQGEQKEKPKSRFQERIDELTAARREAERREAAAVARARDLEKRLTPPGPQASLEEVDEYRMRKVLTEDRVEELHTEAQSAQAEVLQKVFDTFTAKAEAAADRMPGLVQKFCSLPEVSTVMASFVADSDKGAEVAHFLAENANEATRISRLPPAHQGIELARLEARMKAPLPDRKISNAPPPPSTIKGGSSPTGKDPEKMSMSEYTEWRKKGGGGR